MRRFCLTAAAVGLAGFLVLGPPARADEPPAGVEVLARGPVHEAFAQPVNIQPEPGLVASKPPPEPVEPPAAGQPKGDPRPKPDGNVPGKPPENPPKKPMN